MSARRRLSIRNCQRGATAVEYALVVSLICLAAIGAMTGVANKTINMWGNVSNEVSEH
ncbi:MAG: Flp family type IVb pilin [Sphingobium sp.]